jgi:hypothetical protein
MIQSKYMRNYKFIFVVIGLIFLIRNYCQAQSLSNIPQLVKTLNADLPLDQIRGTYGVWYKADNCTNRNGINHSSKITKPFIICEGFDMANGMKLTDLYDQLNGNSPNNFLDQLRYDGYDIIILNLFDNTKSITKNSRLPII